MNEYMRTSSLEEELGAGHSFVYFTIGVSMKPLLIERKTHVQIAPIHNVKKDDLLLYVRKNGAKVLHRCIRIDSTHYYMRGDNTCGLECIEKEQALGKVTHIYRGEKIFDVDKSKKYKFYVAFWNAIYPVRWLMQKAKSVLRKIIKGISSDAFRFYGFICNLVLFYRNH